jgi:hypothetical protein
MNASLNIEARVAIIRRYGSQIRASKSLAIKQSRLSKLMHGHDQPTPEERERLTALLGADYFASSDGEQRVSEAE